MNSKEAKQQRLLSTDGLSLTENTYNVVIGLTLLWGIVINVVMAWFLTPYILMLNYWLVLILYFVLSIGSVIVVFRSHNPVVSFLGFTGLAIGMGLMLTFYLTAFTSATIYSAFLATGVIVVVMMIMSMIYPRFFLSIGRVLGLALIGSIVVELVGGLLFHLSLGFMDYIIVVIFAGFVGYDWAKAQAYPKTLDNAIDSAADIYVDIINIFIRVLSIMGKKD